MEYLKAVRKIKSYIPSGPAKWNKNYGLAKIRNFLLLLGNPQNELKFVHIGGTSGKGSTATFLASILTTSGYKTGLHVSPDVLTVRERMQINGVNIAKKRFVKIFTEIQPAIAEMTKDYGITPSYFEILLAMTFIYFKEEHCDIVVLEVGLGGKLDATNVVDCTYQIITNVALDHTAILGDTKELILRDKQEIIKPGSYVVSGIKEPELQQILEKKVQETGSELALLGRDFRISNIKKAGDNKNIFDLTTVNHTLSGIRTGLPGLFQVQNAALAIVMAQKLTEKFPKITEQSIRSGIEQAAIPGRFQVFSSEPLGIIDGAHNPDKMAALVTSLGYYYPGMKFVTVFRFKKRKDIDQTLALLRQVSVKIIMTRSKKSGDMGLDPVFDDSDREKYQNDSIYVFEPDPGKAYQLAKNYAAKYGTGILATGSLYMINEFLQLLKK